MKETKQTKTRYKIGTVAREAGVAPQTVRYYEKEELIHSRKEEYGTTRYFSVRQLKKISNIRRFFKLGFGEENVRRMLNCQTVDEIEAMFSERQQQNEAEIEELQLRARMLEAYSQRISQIDHLLGRAEEVLSPALCVLVTREGERIIETPEVEAEMACWVERIHLSALSSIIPREVFCWEPDSGYRLSGHCMEEDLLEWLNGQRREEVLRHIAPCRCLHTVCMLTGENLSPISLMPEIYETIRSRNLRVCGDVFGRVLAILGEAEMKEREHPRAVYYEYWVPIENAE